MDPLSRDEPRGFKECGSVEGYILLNLVARPLL